MSENHESGKHKLVYVLSRRPVFALFQDELEARKSSELSVYSQKHN